jgi:hypothetical protein
MELLPVVATNVYVFIMAVVLAILEIQIEGKNGWAKNLPTWRPNSSKWYVKIYSKMLSGKEMTGYHATMFTFVILIFNLPYVFGLSLTLEHWIKTLSLILFFMVFWDFFWFVLNPWYPLSKFKKEHIGFHHLKWFLGIPTDYWGGVAASFIVLTPVAFFLNLNYLYSWWLVNFGMFMGGALLLILFSLYILKIDKWHQSE